MVDSIDTSDAANCLNNQLFTPITILLFEKSFHVLPMFGPIFLSPSVKKNNLGYFAIASCAALDRSFASVQ